MKHTTFSTESDQSLSLADSTSIRLRPDVRAIGTAAVLFVLFAIIGPPVFWPVTSLVVALLLALTAAAVQLSGQLSGRTSGTASAAASSSPRTEGLWERLPGKVLYTGIFFLLTALAGAGVSFPLSLFGLGTVLFSIGAWWLVRDLHHFRSPSEANHGVQQNTVTSRGAVGWFIGVIITGFYVLVYWFPESLEGIVRTTDGLSRIMRGKASDQWFMYGLFYSLAVLIMGVRSFYKYRHSRYHIIRTASVVFFQLIFAFLIPSILVLFQQPEFYFSYFWPLKWQYLWPGDYGFGWILRDGGRLGVFMIGWAAIMSVVATPVLTYFYGKRWYCSWVCGCGGIAETMGDPFRHLSDNSVKVWRLERWLIYSVLVFIVIATAIVWTNSATEGAILGGATGTVANVYGFLVGAVWAGVIGMGFYPILGSRTWCRFGCPMAAILGLFQKYYSRFRITTNGGQCISCGNCSVYCEMGIDVRWYAQRGQNIVRASCVGCGICSTVCPRGVLKLENGPNENRTRISAVMDRDAVGMLSAGME